MTRSIVTPTPFEGWVSWRFLRDRGVAARERRATATATATDANASERS